MKSDGLEKNCRKTFFRLKKKKKNTTIQLAPIIVQKIGQRQITIAMNHSSPLSLVSVKKGRKSRFLPFPSRKLRRCEERRAAETARTSCSPTEPRLAERQCRTESAQPPHQETEENEGGAVKSRKRSAQALMSFGCITAPENRERDDDPVLK